MKISEIMHEGIISAQVTDHIRSVARLMKENDIGALPVLENGKPVGFVTDRDLVICLADTEASLEDEVSLAMSPEVFSVSADADVTEAARIMEMNQVSRLLVVNGDAPVGILTLQDLSLNLENTHLKAEIVEQIKR